MKHMKLFFNSVERCIEYAAQSLPVSIHRGSRWRRDEEWCGCKSYNHAIQIAREGLNLETIQTAMSELSIGVRPQEEIYSVSGSFVDIGRFIEGEPECMVSFEESQDTKFIDVKFLMSENAYVTPEVFTNKAIVLASIVDRLESSGYRVRLIACCRVGHSSHFSFDVDMVVKDYAENLSLGQLAGCVAVSFFRKVIFSIIEIVFAGEGLNAVDHGYGQSIGWRAEDHDGSLMIGQHRDPHDFRKDLKSITDKILEQYGA